MRVPFAGVLSGWQERAAAKEVLEGEWLTHGKYGDEFEKEFSKYIGGNYGLLVNSGSSANLLALAALNLSRNARIIVAGGGFPATLNPILHLGFEPVIVDLNRETHQIDLDQVEAACRVDTKDRPDAIIFAHTLGIPVDMNRMMAIAKEYNLKVIEDCCEAIGTMWEGQMVGTFGDVATFSFYPSHHMTAAGGGGMVVTNDKELALRMKSMREWGKRQIDPGFEGDYITEFSSEVEPGLPYARNYIYDTIGWNMKYPDVNAAYGLENLRRMIREGWNQTRLENYNYIWNRLAKFTEYLDTPTVPVESTPSSFGYCVTVKEDCPIGRDEMVEWLIDKGIQCRPFFAGNILRQPAYRDMKFIGPKNLENSDYFMRNSFFFGVWPGLDGEHMDYIAQCFEELFDAKG